MTQPSLLGSTNRNFEENPQVSCVSKKDEKEEVEKKLPNEYEPLFTPKCLWLFNMHIFIQYAYFQSIDIFLFDRHIFI